MEAAPLSFIERGARDGARSAVVWLHGLGADGHDFAPIVPELDLPEELRVRFLFPHAPRRAVTINGGMVMRAWYDVPALDLSQGEDEAGIRGSARSVEEFVSALQAQGIESRRIVLAGFSQGGAIALHAGLRASQPLAGVLALSTYLPLADSVVCEATTANSPLDIMMAHGSADSVIPVELGRTSSARLQALGHWVGWREYPMEHEVCVAEIQDIRHWLCEVLGS
jgi:phospholipase/carboxylesterase